MVSLWVLLILAPLACGLMCPPGHECPREGAVTVRVRAGHNATLTCPSQVHKTVKLTWYMARRAVLIGVSDPLSDQIAQNGSFVLRKDGTLFVPNADRNLVEEYECVTTSAESGDRSSFILLRLDFSYFYEGPLFGTLFYGSCLVSLIACVASFILNILWIIVRQISLWWINRSERISRVRTMVEAMEKYRQRQVEALHENYQKKVQAVRDNYHQQVEEIRQSYAKQADRFRGYRQAQLEQMTQHLDNIRENYNQQLNRIREYGSRRAEQLVESYEKQMNRMRTFTLQHRLKLMRQYKVKQQYINRLLENIANTDNARVITENEQKIRAALDLPEHDLPRQPHFHARLPRQDISRSASFYSLPEFVLDDDDTRPYRRQLPNVNFTVLKRDEMEPGPSGTFVETSKAEIDDSRVDAPLLGHYRRRSSAKRAMSRDPDSQSTGSH